SAHEILQWFCHRYRGSRWWTGTRPPPSTGRASAPTCDRHTGQQDQPATPAPCRHAGTSREPPLRQIITRRPRILKQLRRVRDAHTGRRIPIRDRCSERGPRNTKLSPLIVKNREEPGSGTRVDGVRELARTPQPVTIRVLQDTSNRLRLDSDDRIRVDLAVRDAFGEVRNPCLNPPQDGSQQSLRERLFLCVEFAP